MSTPRLPFNPRDTAAAKRPMETQACAASKVGFSGAKDNVLTISQLSALIGAAVEKASVGAIRVAGEVSGFRSGTHWYFVLKDAEAVVSCAMFANVARKAKVQPRDGQMVECRGRLEWYAKAGKVSFLVESMEVMGAGSLDAQYRALVDEVRGLGWFAQERKRSLPVIARRVAVVTSRSGAALQDVLATMRRRCAGVGVLLVDVRVQGDVAAEIIGAIREVSRRAVELGVDALLLTRGGGSAEELFLFNDKEIARAIVECSVPVVAAIGHETDTTIAELVADERCATPTQAAMRLTPDRAALERQLDSARVRLHASVRQSIALRRERVRAMSRSAALSTPIGAIAPLKARVQEAASRLDRAAERRLTFLSERVHTASLTLARVRPDVTLAERRERVGAMGRALDRVVRTRRGEMQILADSLARQLDALSPLRTLERGYSITTHKDGRIVRSASSVRGGEVVRTRVADGNFDSVTTGGADQPASCASDPRPERTGRGAVGDSAALFE